MQTCLSNKVAARAPVAARPARASRRTVTVRADLTTAAVIGGSTAAFLAVGRIAFLPFQRRTNKAAAQTAGPKTEGNTYFDSLQKEASWIKTTNDPDGFGIVDVLGWGALGHAVGFAILAAISAGGRIPGVGP